MLTLAAAVLALAAGAPAYHPPRPPRAAEVEAPGPDPALSDAEVEARVESHLGAIDVPITTGEWRALGPRAVPLLERVLLDREELPTRRAAAVAGLACIGGTRARELVAGAAGAEDEPFAVRAAALHGAPRVLRGQELARRLDAVLGGARDPSVRAAAAEVLARHGPRSACVAVRAQADREGQGRARFQRALDRCAARR
jgi:hypothetical protein